LRPPSTELLWGSVALALVRDWYTLEGHICMVVVPAMVVSTHETLRMLWGDPDAPGDASTGGP
jgi:hypothetical protein